jgi:heme O synthase-like polyprenyltransferase
MVNIKKFLINSFLVLKIAKKGKSIFVFFKTQLIVKQDKLTSKKNFLYSWFYLLLMLIKLGFIKML